MPQPSESLLKETISNFECSSNDEALEIATNFLGFSRLIFKLDCKRKAKIERKQPCQQIAQAHQMN